MAGNLLTRFFGDFDLAISRILVIIKLMFVNNASDIHMVYEAYKHIHHSFIDNRNNI